MASSVYVDTYGSSGNYFDFGNPPSGPGITTQLAGGGGKVLIDVRNTHGMQDIWDTFVSGSVNNAVPVNIEVFWDG